MVEAGQSRLACGPCKLRGLKCDLIRPVCKYCRRTNRSCFGVKDRLDKDGRDIEQYAKRSQNLTVVSKHRTVPGFMSPAADRPISINNDQLVLGALFNIWIPMTHRPSNMPQFFSALEPLYKKAEPGSPLPATVLHWAWLVAGMDRFKAVRYQESKRKSSQALSQLRLCLMSPGRTYQPDVLLAVIILSTLEINAKDFLPFRSETPATSHIRGAITILNQCGKLLKRNVILLLVITQLIELLTFNYPELIPTLSDDICSLQESDIHAVIHPVLADQIYEGIAVFRLQKEAQRLLRASNNFKAANDSKQLLSRCKEFDTLLSMRLLRPPCEESSDNAEFRRWNTRRAQRVLLHTIILERIDYLYAYHGGPSPLNEIRFASSASTSVIVIREMVQDILETVPEKTTESPIFTESDKPMSPAEAARFLILGPLSTASRAPALSQSLKRDVKEAFLKVVGNITVKSLNLNRLLTDMESNVWLSEYLESHPQLLGPPKDEKLLGNEKLPDNLLPEEAAA